MKKRTVLEKVKLIFSPSSLVRHCRGIRNARKILELGGYRDVCNKAGVFISKSEDIWKHYKDIGSKNNINPCELFNAQWYMDYYLTNDYEINPLLHYLVIGERHGLNINSILNPKALYKQLSSEPPYHKSYLLAIMKKYKILENNNLYYCNTIKNYTYKVIDGISYIKENKIKCNIIEKNSIGDEFCNFYLKNPFFRFSMPYYTTFNNIKILSNTSNIIVDNKTVVNDELYNSIQIKNIYGPPLKDQTYQILDKNILTIHGAKECRKKINKGIHLTKEYNSNYFHFIYEVAVKLSYIDDNKIFDKDIPVLVSGDLHHNLLFILNLININNRKIIKLKKDEIVHVNKLKYLSDLTLIANTYDKVADENVTILPKKILTSFKNKVLNNVNIKGKYGEKIYISRKSNVRRVVNEDIIEKYLSENGFTIINMDNFSFVDQVTLFSKAKLIISPTGASMANLLWCKPHTKVIILYPDHPRNNYSFWKEIAKITDIDLKIITGTPIGDIIMSQPHISYEISLEVLQEALLETSDFNKNRK